MKPLFVVIASGPRTGELFRDGCHLGGCYLKCSQWCSATVNPYEFEVAILPRLEGETKAETFERVRAALAVELETPSGVFQTVPAAERRIKTARTRRLGRAS